MFLNLKKLYGSCTFGTRIICKVPKKVGLCKPLKHCWIAWKTSLPTTFHQIKKKDPKLSCPRLLLCEIEKVVSRIYYREGGLQSMRLSLSETSRGMRLKISKEETDVVRNHNRGIRRRRRICREKVENKLWNYIFPTCLIQWRASYV